VIPKECKRLIEVDFPIAEVSKHSAREKSIRHGHPSTLHLWWARRPLAACRAVLLGLLLPDPCDPHCPADFKKAARKLLGEPMVAWKRPGRDDVSLRASLLSFIADFSNWDNSANQTYLRVGRGLVKAAHPEETPLVVDPFAGGGSIPLEALRLGCDAFASDLNPVACLILKVMLEDIPRYGNADFTLKDDKGKEIVVHGLADALRHVGGQIKRAAEKELAEFYPKDPDGARPIAYLWARTVRCESPNCGAEIPLMRSFWLCTKANRRRALKHKVVRPKGELPRVEFEVFEPKTEQEVHTGTVARAKATCLCCGTVLPPERVRAQLREQRGGADVIFDKNGNRTGGARMLAVVTLQPGEQGRHYRLASERDYQPVSKAQKRLKAILNAWERGGRNGLCPVPDEPTPAGGGSGAGRAFSVQRYGMMQWGDLFTARQKVAMVNLTAETQRAHGETALREALSLALTRAANAGCSLCRWHLTGEKHEGVYSRQALPIVWDYSEGNPLSAATGGYEGALEWVHHVVEAWPQSAAGHVECADARQSSLPEESVAVWFTDPPYYDAVPYADLSDFFFVWLKRALPDHTSLTAPVHPGHPLTPKVAEIVQDETKEYEGRPKDRAFFESAMGRAFADGRRRLKEDGIGSVVFAHKTTEGWEALIGGLVAGGWLITASWPITTEMAARLRARESAALAASVHLVCRPRPEDAPVGDWDHVRQELPARVREWMDRLQAEGVRGADLVFACIGPALEIYSRYSKVVDAQDRKIPLGGNPEATEPHERGFLAYVWETVGRIALQQILGVSEARARNAAAGALEEDARLTALFLWTLQSTEALTPEPSPAGRGDGEGTGEEEEPAAEETDEEEPAPSKKPRGQALIFDVARRFAQPLGIHLEEWEDRIIRTEKGVVYLLPVRDRAKQLFGEEGADAVADQIEETPRGPIQQLLFPKADEGAVPEVRGRRRRGRAGVSDEQLRTRREATTLDRVHAAMLLQASGRANALRAMLKAEMDRGPDFLRLANALSALYPRSSEEKRLLDAMLLAVPR